MEQKPIYFDGSVQLISGAEGEANEPFQITDEMRKNIGVNPYSAK